MSDRWMYDRNRPICADAARRLSPDKVKCEHYADPVNLRFDGMCSEAGQKR